MVANNIGLDVGGTYTLEYTMINKAFGLADGTQSSITMVQKASAADYRGR